MQVKIDDYIQIDKLINVDNGIDVDGRTEIKMNRARLIGKGLAMNGLTSIKNEGRQKGKKWVTRLCSDTHAPATRTHAVTRTHAAGDAPGYIRSFYS